MPASAEEKLEYILFCLAHTGTTVNGSFDKVAELKQVYSGNDARKKFKRFIEECGEYVLEGKTITIKDGAAPPTPATSGHKKANGSSTKKTPAKTRGKVVKNAKPAAKKRKAEKEDDVDIKSDSDDTET